MRVLGIDPGLTGALALYDSVEGSLVVTDIPTFTLTRGGKTKKEIDLGELARVLDVLSADRPTVFIEKVGALPGQGVSAVFSFGKTTGILLGMCAAHFLRIEQVPPVTWKRALKVPAAKDGARARASEILPRHGQVWSRVKDDGRAEAALIAVYGSLQPLAGSI